MTPRLDLGKINSVGKIGSFLPDWSNLLDLMTSNIRAGKVTEREEDHFCNGDIINPIINSSPLYQRANQLLLKNEWLIYFWIPMFYLM